MSADDATDALAPDADPNSTHTTDYGTRNRSTPTRQTAAYWSMTRTMADLS